MRVEFESRCELLAPAIAVLIIFCLNPAVSHLSAQTLPALPSPVIESFGSSVREQVRRAYEEARAKPRDAGASGRLGMVLQAYEQYEMAAACYERARSLAPKEFRWAYYLGTVQAVMGKHLQAAAAFQEALRQMPDDLPAQLRLADALFASGDSERSRQAYEAVLKKYPNSPQAHYGLGRVLSARRELAAAIRHYHQACELSKSFGAAHYALGLAYRDFGQLDKAKEHLSIYQKNQLVRPPLNDPRLAAVAELNLGALEHLKNAVSLEAAGQIEGSVAEHERALEINPQLLQARTNLISLYNRLGQAEKAEAHYRAAIEINPNSAEGHYNFGVLLNGQGKYQEAAQAFLRSLEINPFFAEANHNYAVMLEREGRFDDAIKYYRAAIENKSDYRLAHFHLARILVRQGKMVEAIDHLLKTLTPEDESTPRFMYALAAAYARAGSYQPALRYMRDARQRAAALGQAELLALIERDLRLLEKSLGSAK